MGSDSPQELQDLAAVHVFYMSVLEKHLGHGVPVPAEVQKALAEPVQAAALSGALKGWLDLLDLAITPPMVRDALRGVESLGAARALLRYFVAKASQRSNDRDKTDCVTTHLFRHPAPDSTQKWQRPEPDSSYYFMSQAALAFQIELYRALGDVQFESMPAEHVQFLHEFEYFYQELDEFRHFDQVTDSNMLQRARELKQSLGRSFYHPDSLANIAVWNDVFGRKFDDLFHEATKQIKTFAEHIQREGGSIMSRVDGDVTVKHLAEVETGQIAEDYQSAQDQFRKISKYKKAVDSKRSGRGTAPVAPRAAPSPPRVAPVAGPPPSAPLVEPIAAPAPPKPVMPAPAPANPGFVARTSAPVPPKAPPGFSGHAPGPPPGQGAEILAVPPSQAVQNAVQEGKIHSARESVRNHVRTVDSKMVNLISVKRSRLALTPAEVEAFRADYQGEKSFRADYSNIMMTMVAYHLRMMVEVDEYSQKAGSAYLWKPHADALAYLLSTLERVGMEAAQVRNVARQRGLHDKADAIEASLEKVRGYGHTVSQTLQSADQNYSS